MTIVRAHSRILTVRDSQILELLSHGASEERIVRIGIYRRSWTHADVTRVAAQYMPPAPAAPTAPAPRVLTVVPARSTRWMPAPPTSAPIDAFLTAREIEVLEGICAGQDNKTIAARLHLSLDTVKSHTKRVLAATGAHDRLQAAVRVYTGQARVFTRTQKDPG